MKHSSKALGGCPQLVWRLPAADSVGASCSGGCAIAALSPKHFFIFLFLTKAFSWGGWGKSWSCYQLWTESPFGRRLQKSLCEPGIEQRCSICCERCDSFFTHLPYFMFMLHWSKCIWTRVCCCLLHFTNLFTTTKSLSPSEWLGPIRNTYIWTTVHNDLFQTEIKYFSSIWMIWGRPVRREEPKANQQTRWKFKFKKIKSRPCEKSNWLNVLIFSISFHFELRTFRTIFRWLNIKHSFVIGKCLNFPYSNHMWNELKPEH